MVDPEVVVVASGPGPDLALPPAPTVVAADGGLIRARALGLHVDVVVGDLDSVTHDALASAEQAGARVVRHPQAKDATDLELDEHSAAWLETEADITSKKNVEILNDYAASGPKDSSHKIVLRFLRSPVEILGEGEDGPVTGVRVVRNEIVKNDDGSLRAVATGDEEVIEAGLVLRSIGYRGKPVDDVPFDERRGLIRNVGGRVCAETGDAHHGEYVVGWIKRGPSGVIGTNKKDSADTTVKIGEDRDAGRLNTPTINDHDAIAAFYAERAPDSVTWAGWEAIDAHEKTSGTGRSASSTTTVSRPVRRERSSAIRSIGPRVADISRNWACGSSSSGTCQAHPRSGSA